MLGLVWVSLSVYFQYISEVIKLFVNSGDMIQYEEGFFYSKFISIVGACYDYGIFSQLGSCRFSIVFIFEVLIDASCLAMHG